MSSSTIPAVIHWSNVKLPQKDCLRLLPQFQSVLLHPLPLIISHPSAPHHCPVVQFPPDSPALPSGRCQGRSDLSLASSELTSAERDPFLPSFRLERRFSFPFSLLNESEPPRAARSRFSTDFGLLKPRLAGSPGNVLRHSQLKQLVSNSDPGARRLSADLAALALARCRAGKPLSRSSCRSSAGLQRLSHPPPPPLRPPAVSAARLSQDFPRPRHCS